jgi:hypothetical protein
MITQLKEMGDNTSDRATVEFKSQEFGFEFGEVANSNSDSNSAVSAEGELELVRTLTRKTRNSLKFQQRTSSATTTTHRVATTRTTPCRL